MNYGNFSTNKKIEVRVISTAQTCHESRHTHQPAPQNHSSWSSPRAGAAERHQHPPTSTPEDLYGSAIHSHHGSCFAAEGCKRTLQQQPHPRVFGPDIQLHRGHIARHRVLVGSGRFVRHQKGMYWCSGWRFHGVRRWLHMMCAELSNTPSHGISTGNASLVCVYVSFLLVLRSFL